MKNNTLGLIVAITSFISTSVFATAPINDLTIDQNYADINNQEVQQQLLELSRLLKTRNKMQVRLQSQLDELSQEVSEVKGSIELFNHKLEQVEDRQRNLYQLVDDQSNYTHSDYQLLSKISDKDTPILIPYVGQKLKMIKKILIKKKFKNYLTL